jgi:diketogulonate reductase-like aldo/keto reductase
MSSNLTITSKVPIKDSPHQIPRLGFGVYQSPVPACVQTCLKAFKSGYRHIDTAQYYNNEQSVGRAIRESKIPRSEFFITTKILYPASDEEGTYNNIIESVNNLDGEEGYVDLFLIHSPNGGAESRKTMWLALERAKKEGKVRNIGVSNYGIGHIEDIKTFGETWPPAVNQIEVCSILL